MIVIHAKDLTQKESSRIFSDSQPAMQSIAKPKRQSGQSIIKRNLDQIDSVYFTTPSYCMQIE
jgi:hypothetical protein